MCPLPGDGSQSNTKWSWPRSTTVPSGILIYPAVWPQQTRAEKVGVLCPFLGELDPHLAQCRLFEVYIPIPSDILMHPTVWPRQTWAENGGCALGGWVPI